MTLRSALHIIPVLTALALAHTSYTLAQERLENPEIVARVSPSIVVVQTYDASGRPLGQGSRFFVSVDGVVATSLHVVSGASTPSIK